MSSYRVDFGKPIVLFPLPGVSLLPHGAQPLHIFEPKYRQMVERCLASGNGDLERADPIAMAVIDDRKSAGVGEVSLCEAVCVGRIARVEQLPSGRFNLLLHGLCRARIDELDPPADQRLHLRAWLRPIEPDFQSAPPLPEARRTIRSLLGNPRLRRLAAAGMATEWLDRDDLPTSVVLDLIGFAVVRDEAIRYRLLEQGDCRRRAETVTRELQMLDRLVAQVDLQNHASWPKGLSWN